MGPAVRGGIRDGRAVVFRLDTRVPRRFAARREGRQAAKGGVDLPIVETDVPHARKIAGVARGNCGADQRSVYHIRWLRHRRGSDQKTQRQNVPTHGPLHLSPTPRSGIYGTVPTVGIIPGNTNCWITTSATRISVRTTLCMKVRAKTAPSWPFSWVTAAPVAMFCGEIILPMTPPDELVAANSTGFRFNCRAATTWRLPNNALPEVSLPDSATAIQPRKGESRMNR